MSVSTATLLAQLFAAGGNQIHPTATGFKTGHEPVHRSESGQCVAIDADKERWYGHSCQQGGDLIKAVMSLKGVSREDAEAYLRERTSETSKSDTSKRPKTSQATALVQLAEKAAAIFHDPAFETYARFTVGEHHEVWPTRTTGFRRWLIRQNYLTYEAVPNADAVTTARQTLEAKAQFDGGCHEVYCRVAPAGDGGVYLDLGDAAWRAVHITENGWSIVATPPVMFRRSPGMLPLLEPVRGGSLEELRPLVNLPSPACDAAWALVKAWLIAGMTPRGPYPVLALRGEQGTANTTLAKLLRVLIDPAKPELRADPKELRDVAIAARACWIVGFDNVSSIHPWLSDALCRLATGSGWATRELYTDIDEVLFDAMRPILLNGITDYIVAPDLLDRTIQLELPTIPKPKRRRERRCHPNEPPGVLDEFELMRPRLLGALLDAVAGALRELPNVRLQGMPRMADFAIIGAAAEKATSQEPWKESNSPFLQAYGASIDEAQVHAIEGSPIGPTLLEVLNPEDWSGTYTALLERLNQAVGEKATRAKGWPKTARGLSGEVRRIAPALRARGYQITTGARDPATGRSMITIQSMTDEAESEHPPAPPSESSVSSDTHHLDGIGPEDRPNETFSQSSSGEQLSSDVRVSEDSQGVSEDLRPRPEDGSVDVSSDQHKYSEDTEDAEDHAAISSAAFMGHADAAAEREVIQAEADLEDPVLSWFESPPAPADQGVDFNVSSHQAVSAGASFEPPAVRYIRQPSRLEAILPELLIAPALALDIETSGLDPLTDSLRTIQVATPQSTLIIDAHTCPPQMLAPVFTTVPRLIGHNLKFDFKFLVAAGLPWPTGQVLDTMLAAQLLGAGTPEGTLRQCSLAAIVERYLHLILDKAEQRSDWTGPLSHRQLRYAAIDAAILLPLADTIEDALRSAGLCRVAAIEGACVPALASLELAGLPVHEAHWRDRAASERHRMEALQATLDALIGHTSGNGDGFTLTSGPVVNWQSPSQVLALLHSRGYAIENTDSLTLLASANGDPLIAHLLDYRDAAKRASTYGDTWLDDHLHPVTERIHADYLQLGSKAGRMSCSRPNVQNLPRSAAYRGAIRARGGHQLVKADFSQIELRLAAAMAPDAAMLAAFRAGKDLHVLTASQVLGIPEDLVEKDQRQLAKALNFGLIYGMGARRLQEHAWTTYRVRMSEDEAIHHRQRFFQTYRGVQQWHRQTAARLKREQALETGTLAGRRRLAVAKFTEALNTPVQDTGADGLKLTLARLFTSRDEAPNTRLIAVVHDEILAECPESDAEATSQWLTRHMTAAMQELVGDVVPMTVDVTRGLNWAG
jgi:DNA polymerase I-like protein with 3'-5' exonuclease and polymerase domains